MRKFNRSTFSEQCTTRYQIYKNTTKQSINFQSNVLRQKIPFCEKTFCELEICLGAHQIYARAHVFATTKRLRNTAIFSNAGVIIGTTFCTLTRVIMSF